MEKRVNMNDFQLNGKIVAVYGGGQTPGRTMGNGKAAALKYAAAGASIAVLDRNREAAEAVVSEILRSGGQANSYGCDITDSNAIRNATAEIISDFGTINILHNNIGVSVAGGDKAIDEIDPDAFRRIFEVNLLGMAMTCKITIPILLENEDSVITNISSIASHAIYPYVAYKATKMGVLGLTQHIATRYAEQGLRCNCISPGLMNTPMAIETRVSHGWDRAQIVAARDAKVPLKKHMGEAQDIANASLFLASDAGRFITGIDLIIDGGTSAFIGAYAE
ncbi:MAG: SDR family oxidoreductase [Candidatus Cloacimonetes bacterium]|nr:SDR family oxidoreductase [Candidatus Cloacimonadota bacterium]